MIVLLFNHVFLSTLHGVGRMIDFLIENDFDQ